MSRLLHELRSGRVLLMDGAMGTELQRAGVRPGECYELWNLTRPEEVRAIHQRYVDAGARCLLTNTFQANGMLAKHGVLDRWREINRAAFDLARSVIPDSGFILADLGPSPWLGLAKEQAVAYLTFVRSLRPDALLLETCGNAENLRIACADRSQAAETEATPLLLSITYGRDASGALSTCVGDACENRPPEYYAEIASKSGVDALGVNCGRDIGMDDVIEIIRRYSKVTNLPLFARPNAGTPTRAGERWVYSGTPKKMAERLPELLEAGVSMAGGCCGTTPEHIAEFRSVIDAWNAQHMGMPNT